VIADALALVDDQLASSQREIADVRSILADAVARLMRDRCDATDKRASGLVVGSDAVTALQFQDLSDQLLAHATSRLDVLRNEVRLVRGGLAVPPAEVESGNWNSIATAVQRNLVAFTERRNRPVAAAHLEPGSIELF
jgi:hypothetical protein